MEKTPIYRKPILHSNDPVTELKYWEEAVDNFEQKDFAASLTATLNYINKDLLKGQQVAEGMNIRHQHGSASVTMQLKDGIFKVYSTFLNVPEKYKVPLLRKVAELNFSPLTLSQIFFDTDKKILHFASDTPLELAQPNKIYDIIKETCLYSDDYDDEFIKRYGASFTKDPKTTALDTATVDRIWNRTDHYLDEALQYIEYYEGKRWIGYIWDTITLTLMKIVDQPHVNGLLKSDIEGKLWYLRHNKQDNLERKNAQGKEFLLELRTTPKEKVLENIYQADRVISPKFRSSLKAIQDYLNKDAPRVNDEYGKENFVSSYYTLAYSFCNLIYTYNLDKEHFDIIGQGLEEASEKPWKEGATILKGVFDDFLSGNILKEVPKPAQKKGFFAKLFS